MFIKKGKDILADLKMKTNSVQLIGHHPDLSDHHDPVQDLLNPEEYQHQDQLIVIYRTCMPNFNRHININMLYK